MHRRTTWVAWFLVGAGMISASCGGASAPATGACDSTGWCWESEPQPIYACGSALVRASGDEWAVCGNVIVRQLGSQITRHVISGAPTDSRGQLLVRANGELWASFESGAVYRFDGTQFTQPSDYRPRSLVMTSGGQDVWGAGENGVYRRWNGADFDAPVTTMVRPVCISDAGEFFFVETDRVVRVQGDVRTVLAPTPPGGQQYACVGRSVIGYSPRDHTITVIPMDGGSTTTVPTPPAMNAMTMTARGEWFIVDEMNRALRVQSDGTLTPTITFNRPVGASASFDIDPVSGHALVLETPKIDRFDGARWTTAGPTASRTALQLVGVAGQPPSALLGFEDWARRDSDGRWTFEPYPAPVTVNGPEEILRDIDPNAQLRTLDDGRIVRWQPSGLSVFSVPDANRGTRLVARSSTHAWVLQTTLDRITVRHWNGTSWTALADTVPGQEILGIDRDDDGALLLLAGTVSPPGGARPSLYRVTEAVVERVQIPSEPASWAVDSGLVRDEANTLWLLLSGTLYYRLAGTAVVTPASVSARIVTRSARGIIGISGAGRAVQEISSSTRMARELSSSAVISGPIWSAGDQLWVAGTDGRVVRRSIAP